MIDQTAAERFAENWIAAWNTHDLERVLALYHDEFEMTSPYILEYANEPSGTLCGKAAVGAYWKTALERNPGLHFELETVLAGVRGVVLLYRTGFRRAAEVLEFDAAGKVVRGEAHYYRASVSATPIEPSA